MVNGRHVHANLMRAARDQVNIQQRAVLFLPDHLPFGARGAALGVNRHLFAVVFAAGNGCVNHARLLLHHARHNGVIVLFHRALAQLRAQRLVRFVILGYHQQAAGVFVQSMHDARAHFAADARQLIEVIHQRVHQRAVRVAGSGMHHHAAGLDHYSQMLVLIENFQRNILRLGLRGLEIGHGQNHLCAGCRLRGGLGFRLAVYRDCAFADQIRRAGARKRAALAQYHVQSGAVGHVFKRLHRLYLPSQRG